MSGYIERPRYQCALGGALAAINSINRAVPIIHSSPGCSTSADAATINSGYWGGSYCGGRAAPSTNILEKEIIFGGEKRLREQIESTLSLVDGDLFAVITGCMTDIIGDDVKSIVDEFRQLGKAIVVAETGGFKGNSSTGYDLILESFFTQYTQKGLDKDPKTVNILGVIPGQDVFWKGDLIEIKRLLGELGLHANTFFTPFETPEQLRTASKAVLNIVLSDVHGIKAAKVFEETHGTPFIRLPFPIGPTATREFLIEIGRRLNVSDEKVHDVIRKEEKYYYTFINGIADIYNDIDIQRNAVVVGESNYTYAVTRFVTEDFGWIPAYAAITDILEEEEKEKVVQRFQNLPHDLRPELIFETDTSQISDYIVKEQNEKANEYSIPISPAFVLGSTLDRTLAANVKAGFLSVAYPIVNRVVTDQGYAGYRGGLRLATEIISVIFSNR